MNDCNMNDWYVLSAPPSLSVSLNELKDCAIDRGNFLSDFVRKRLQSAEKLLDAHNLLGIFLLYAAASLSSPLRSMVIEKEGDLFVSMLFKEKSSKQDYIINMLLDNNTITMLDFKRLYRDVYENITRNRISTTKLIVFKIYAVPEIIVKKSYYLHDEWAIVELSHLMPFLKRIYERKLYDRIMYYGSLIMKNDAIMAVSKSVLKYFEEKNPRLTTKVVFDKNVKLNNVLDNVDIFPPCIKYLVKEMEEKRYLPDSLRVQLALFLKSVGMTLDDQLKYWWSMSIDNVGLTYDDWERKYAPRIVHLYGQRGGHIDYKSLSCEKSIDNYFCPFSQFHQKDLNKFLNELYGHNDYEEILKQSNYKNPQVACMMLYKIKNSIRTKKMSRIYSPLSWIRLFNNQKQKYE